MDEHYKAIPIRHYRIKPLSDKDRGFFIAVIIPIKYR